MECIVNEASVYIMYYVDIVVFFNLVYMRIVICQHNWESSPWQSKGVRE